MNNQNAVLEKYKRLIVKNGCHNNDGLKRTLPPGSNKKANKK
jgi:hypothetical protein